MKNLTKCAKIISYNEGCRLKAYKDSLGYWTVGIGLLLDASGIQTLKECGAPDPLAVLHGTASITLEQAQKALELILPKYVALARNAFDPGVFDSFSEARQCVFVDMSYNMGDTKSVFPNSMALINEAQKDKLAGHDELAHDKFLQAAHNLKVSAWHSQVGARADRDIGMLVSGDYVEPFRSM